MLVCCFQSQDEGKSLGEEISSFGADVEDRNRPCRPGRKKVEAGGGVGPRKKEVLDGNPGWELG